ncbi:hypothetical protein P7M49_13245, partial [Vibrio parahaemolyticus]|nr:hypothetical protein [Vibrio parahaemolyticus]
WLQPCLLKIYSHMVTFWGNYEGISQCSSLTYCLKRQTTLTANGDVVAVLNEQLLHILSG